MHTVKLFSEAVEDVEYICEEKESGKKNYKIRGIFMQADVKNRNGRVYPMEVLSKEVAKYNKNFIQEKIRLFSYYWSKHRSGFLFFIMVTRQKNNPY